MRIPRKLAVGLRKHRARVAAEALLDLARRDGKIEVTVGGAGIAAIDEADFPSSPRIMFASVASPCVTTQSSPGGMFASRRR